MTDRIQGALEPGDVVFVAPGCGRCLDLVGRLKRASDDLTRLREYVRENTRAVDMTPRLRDLLATQENNDE